MELQQSPHRNELDKLESICARLASTHDGEVLAAARAANRILGRAKLTWRDVVRAPGRVGPKLDHAALAKRILAVDADKPFLTDWERKFCESVIRFVRITDKQTATLERMAFAAGVRP